MPRRPLTTLSAISLALLLATCAAWAVSHSVAYEARRQARVGEGTGYRTVVVRSDAGRVRVITLDDPCQRPGWSWTSAPPDRSDPSILEDFDVNTRFPGITVVRFPHYALAALFAILPLRWLWVRWRKAPGRGFEVEGVTPRPR